MCLVPMAAFADTISGSSGAGWQSWSTSVLNDEDGAPYWNSNSWDGPAMNIGNCLSGTGNCAIGSNPGNVPYWGLGNGTADTDITFLNTSSSNGNSIEGEFAGNADFNSLGWYDTTDPSVLHPIISGSSGDGANATFTPSASYGFYFEDAAVGEIWYSNSLLNSPSEQGDQHFAIFEGAGGSYWMGMEDLSFSNSDKDYNDMIVKVTPAPEVGTLSLLCTGLFGLGGMLRRRLKI